MLSHFIRNIIKVIILIVLPNLLATGIQAQSSKGNTKSSIVLSKLGNKIIDTIISLKEVKAQALYVLKQTKGTRHLQYSIWQKPTKKKPYYWVKVMEDNGSTYYTHFNFYVYPGSLRIKYLDTMNDRAIDLETWRKHRVH